MRRDAWGSCPSTRGREAGAAVTDHRGGVWHHLLLRRFDGSVVAIEAGDRAKAEVDQRGVPGWQPWWRLRRGVASGRGKRRVVSFRVVRHQRALRTRISLSSVLGMEAAPWGMR